MITFPNPTGLASGLCGHGSSDHPVLIILIGGSTHVDPIAVVGSRKLTKLCSVRIFRSSALPAKHPDMMRRSHAQWLWSHEVCMYGGASLASTAEKVMMMILIQLSKELSK